MVLTNEAQQQFREHVLAEYPTGEACGVVIGDAYYQCKNVHPEPKGAFKFLNTELIGLQNTHGTVQAVLHSHIYEPKQSQQYYKDKYNPAWPSVADQQGFLRSDCDWGIVASDGKGISDFVWLSHQPRSFERRQFAWFESDCFAIVKDWYALNMNIDVPNTTRKWEFWKDGSNTIEDHLDHLASIGFLTKLSTEHAQVGDTAIFQVAGSPVPNHVGVIVADNTMLHTFPNEGYYAHTTEWHKWSSKAKYIVRVIND